MSLIYPNRYPDRYDPQSTSYPQGKFRNRSSVEAHDGGYFEQDLMNDWSGFFGALLHNGEVVPNGQVDTALNSQYYDALVKALNIESQPITSDYSATRQYKSGELIFVNGIWYECYNQNGCKGIDPTDPKNRPSGWVDPDIHSQYYWVEIGKYLMLPEIGSPIPLATMQVREGLIKYRNDGQLSAQKFWRIAEQNPNLVNDGFIEIADLRANVIRGLDDGKNIDVGRVINSYQGDAIKNITGSAGGIVGHHANEATSGVFRASIGSEWAASGNQDRKYRTLLFDLNYINYPIADEIRMKNIAMLMCCRI